jgi:hypothetical protein
LFGRDSGFRRFFERTLGCVALITNSAVLALAQTMNNGDSQRQPKSLSIEEQHHEASQDDTGRLQRYLRLAEKMLQTDDGENEDQTNPFHNSQAA